MSKIRLTKPLVIDSVIEGDMPTAFRDLAEVLEQQIPTIDEMEHGDDWKKMAKESFARRAKLLYELADWFEEADWEEV